MEPEMTISFDKRNQRWRMFIDIRIDGKRIRKSRLLPRGVTESEAMQIDEENIKKYFVAGFQSPGNTVWTEYVSGLLKAKHSWLDDALTKCRYRSRLKDRDCTLTRNDIAYELSKSGGRCAVTGIPFDPKALPGKKFRPYMHSIDRIDSSQGYTPDNIRFVCAAVNNAMMHWGEAMFAELAVGYVLKKYGVHPAAQAMQAAMVEKQEPGMAKEFPQNKNDSAE
jgi:hypothetical protein